MIMMGASENKVKKAVALARMRGSLRLSRTKASLKMPGTFSNFMMLIDRD
jgi:hypothetical protein